MSKTANRKCLWNGASAFSYKERVLYLVVKLKFMRPLVKHRYYKYARNSYKNELHHKASLNFTVKIVFILEKFSNRLYYSCLPLPSSLLIVKQNEFTSYLIHVVCILQIN